MAACNESAERARVQRTPRNEHARCLSYATRIRGLIGMRHESICVHAGSRPGRPAGRLFLSSYRTGEEEEEEGEEKEEEEEEEEEVSRLPVCGGSSFSSHPSAKLPRLANKNTIPLSLPEVSVVPSYRYLSLSLPLSLPLRTHVRVGEFRKMDRFSRSTTARHGFPNIRRNGGWERKEERRGPRSPEVGRGTVPRLTRETH